MTYYTDLLEICDRTTTEQIVAAEKHLAGVEGDSDFEEDLAAVTGKELPKNKKEKRNEDDIEDDGDESGEESAGERGDKSEDISEDGTDDESSEGSEFGEEIGESDDEPEGMLNLEDCLDIYVAAGDFLNTCLIPYVVMKIIILFQKNQQSL